MSARGTPPATTSLRGRWLLLARVAWVSVALLAVVVFVVGLPAYYEQLRAFSGPIGSLFSPELADPASVRANLARLGLSASFYAAYIVALEVFLASAFCAVGMVIFWSKSDDWMALIGAAFLVLQVGEAPTLALAAAYPAWRFPVDLLGVLAVSSFILFFYLFPNGRFVPRWTRWIAVVGVLVTASITFFPGWDARYPYPTVVIFYLSGLTITCVFAQLYRYVRVSGPVQRQQTKWVVFGLTTAVVGVLGVELLSALFPALDRTGTLADLAAQTAENLFILLVPGSIGVAVLRYRLWDIDIIINRTLVYGSLTALLALVYFGGVATVQAIFHALTGQQEQPQLAIVVSTLVIAALFNPLRRRIQGFIDRRFYRRKYDAAKTLEAFSAKLRDETDLDALSDDLVGVVKETMQPTHVSLWLRPDTASKKGNQTD